MNKDSVSAKYCAYVVCKGQESCPSKIDRDSFRFGISNYQYYSSVLRSQHVELKATINLVAILKKNSECNSGLTKNFRIQEVLKTHCKLALEKGPSSNLLADILSRQMEIHGMREREIVGLSLPRFPCRKGKL